MEDKQEMEKEISGHKRMKVVFIRTNVLFPGQILSFELDKNNDVLRLMEEALPRTLRRYCVCPTTAEEPWFAAASE